MRRVLELTVIVVALVTGVSRLRPWDVRVDPAWFASLLVAAAAVALLGRRRHPAAVFAVAVAANVADQAADSRPGGVVEVALLVACYSLAAHGDRIARLLLPALAVAPIAVAAERGLGDWRPALAFAAAALLLPWLTGAAVRIQRGRTLDRAARIKAEQDLQAVRAVVDERARIARELHDIVAHHVSVMGVQAGAARLFLDTDPSRTREALHTIESTSRQAIEEMRRMLGVLRQDPASTRPPSETAGTERGLAEQPGLVDLHRLAGDFAEVGVPVRIDVGWEADRAGWPSEALQLSAYRIVEQSLTNALEHSGKVRTSARIAIGSGEVRVEVTNDPAAGRPEPRGANRGHGTVGMRERVALFGGRFEAGPREGGGYRVLATLRTDPA